MPLCGSTVGVTDKLVLLYWKQYDISEAFTFSAFIHPFLQTCAQPFLFLLASLLSQRAHHPISDPAVCSEEELPCSEMPVDSSPALSSLTSFHLYAVTLSTSGCWSGGCSLPDAPESRWAPEQLPSSVCLISLQLA